MRLLDVFISENEKSEYEEILKHFDEVESWSTKTDSGSLVFKILIKDEDSRELILALEKKSNQNRVIIYPVEGTLPNANQLNPELPSKVTFGKFVTVSKEELYDDIEQPVNLTLNFILMVILSSFVAGIGILKNNVAIVIGAMVIAPFLGPNVSLAFGTTLGDLKIIKKSAITGIVATLIALGISVLWGFLSGEVDGIPREPTIEYQDILLALICGFAGVISIVSGQGSTLVGVMVAAALLPPLMRAGLFAGGGAFTDAFNSFLIFSANIVCLNIAGIIAFYFGGIRPSLWWENKLAKSKTRTALIFWTIALVLIMLIILYGYFV